MVGEETELVFLDEWSENTLQADLAKIVLQGGYTVTCAKHQSPKTLINKAPFYITTNELPNFGSEHDNVMRRVKQHALHCMGCPRDRVTFRFLE